METKEQRQRKERREALRHWPDIELKAVAAASRYASKNEPRQMTQENLRSRKRNNRPFGMTTAGYAA